MSEGNQDLILIRSIKSMYFMKYMDLLKYSILSNISIIDSGYFFILDVIPDMILINLYKHP